MTFLVFTFLFAQYVFQSKTKVDLFSMKYGQEKPLLHFCYTEISIKIFAV